jgi:alpha-tubulin suppressor-like RCC1 family protein
MRNMGRVVGMAAAAALAGATMIPGIGSGVATAAAQTTQPLYSWGTFAQNAPSVDSPQTIVGVPDPIVEISGSDRDMYALTSAGTVWAWGAQIQGALGNGTTGTSYVTTPVQVKFPAGVSIASLPAQMPQKTGMAIDTNGNVWGWGAAGHDDLCGLAQNSDVPLEVTAPQLAGDVVLASGQNNHTIFYTSTGKLYGCGANTAGQLGNGTFTAATSPVPVTGLPNEPVTSVQTAWENSGVLLADGTYWDWGYNTTGQLGDGSTAPSALPVQVNLPAAVNTVSEGGSVAQNGQTIAVLSNGSVYTWGNDARGQLGIGYHERQQTVPVAVDVPPGVIFVSVASGGASEYAIDSTGNVWSWGQNNYGQLGIGTTKGKAKPVSVGIHATQIVSIANDVAAFSSAG